MTIFLWIIGIHLLEALCIVGYFLYIKNNKLMKIVTQQQDYINAIQIIINNSNEHISKLDANGTFQSDDEVGNFFNNIKEIQNTLNKFNNLER